MNKHLQQARPTKIISRVLWHCLLLLCISINSAWSVDKSRINVGIKEVRLAADFNRDGIIEFTDSLIKNNMRTDLNTEAKPYVFWVNDDDDDPDSETSGRDISGNETNQRIDALHTNIIDGSRDLIDFFAVAIDLHNYLTTSKDTDKKTYWLQQKENAVNIVYTEMSRGNVSNPISPNASQYLRKININNVTDIFGSWQTNGSLNEVSVHRVTEKGIQLPEEFVSLMKEDDSKGVILVEGRSETMEPLKFIVKDENNNIILDATLPMRIYGVQKLFRQVSLRSNLFGTQRDEVSKIWGESPTGVDPDVSALLTNLVEQSDSIITRMPELNMNKNVIFIHGFKSDFTGAIEFQSETFKRLYHSGSNALFTGVHWHGNEGLFAGINYWDNVENAFYTADDFAVLVNGISGSKVIVAHSLGNMVVGSAIQDFGMQFNKYFMLNPAVALEAYQATATNPNEMHNPDWDDYYFGAPSTDYGIQDGRKLWSTEWYNFFNGTNDKRKILTWRGRFTDVANNPNVIQYFSSGEEVLQQASYGDPNDLEPVANGGRNAWNIQEKGKGTSELVAFGGGSEAGWGFNVTCETDVFGEETCYGNGLLTHDDAQTFFDKLKDELIQTPFFDPFSNAQLHDVGTTEANSEAVVYRDYPRTLAYELPALSFAAGGTVSSIFALSNNAIDMNTEMTEMGIWPTPRLQELGSIQWLHSDFKDVAYRYTYKLFDDMTDKGALK